LRVSSRPTSSAPGFPAGARIRLMAELGKLLLVLGGMAVIVGALLLFAGRLHLGHLPGDIVVRGRHATFYLPLGTSLLLSVAISLILWLFYRK
jgi:Protein of unknown function (DUF2905)